MRQEQIVKHKLTNFIQTVLLLAGMLVLLAFLGFFVAGTSGLVWASILGGFFLLFGQHLSPQLLLRLNRARPLAPAEAPELYQLVQRLAQRAKLPVMPRLYYIPGRMMNAFAVGRRDEAAIAVTEGLLRHLDRRELAGVLAHEISHIHHNDIRVMSVADLIGRLTRLFSLFGQFLLIFNLPLLLLGTATISWFAILLLIVAPTLNGLLQLALSRTREFNADLGAVSLTGDPEGLARALQKLDYYQQHLFRHLFIPGYRAPDSAIFRTHPKTSERIKRLYQVAEFTQKRPVWPDQQDTETFAGPRPRLSIHPLRQMRVHRGFIQP